MLYEHQLSFHPVGRDLEPGDFKMRILGCYSRAIVRQCREGISISRALGDRDRGQAINIKNSKKEFIQPGTIRPRFGRLLAGDDAAVGK